MTFEGESSGARSYGPLARVRPNPFAILAYMPALAIALSNLVRLTGAGRRNDALVLVE